MPLTAPYGSWKSPIRADLLTEKSLSLAEVLIDHVSSEIYWVEGRPYESGRNVPVMDNKDVIPTGWNARTRVHEYGGAAVAVHGGVLYFTDFKSSRVYRVDKAGDAPVPVTPDNPAHRFGDFAIHPTHPHILVSILEDHTKPAPADVINTLVCVNTATSTISTLAKEADFYASPTISPDGKHLAWVQWSHPNMPWEASQVYIAEIAPTVSSESGALETFAVSGRPAFVSGSDESSVSQPLWASNSSLTFLYDIHGFYNPWVYDLATSSARPILPTPVAADFADPAWQLGMHQYDFLDPTTILATPIQDSNTVLTLIDLPTGEMRPIASPYVDIKGLHAISATEAVFVGAQDTEAFAFVKIKLEYTDVGPVSASFTTLKESSTLASTNPDYVSDGQEKPPCIVNVHGGPTSRAAPGLNWTIQYFTSRGWALYRGRELRRLIGIRKDYRDRLRGNWGIVDVDDCVAAVRLLGEQGIIDPRRAAIRGGSAGGFTVLASLVKYPGAFAAGNSFYGVTNLAGLSEDTHKFESRYLEKLIGGTIEEVPGVYKDRSPLYHADKIKAPLLVRPQFPIYLPQLHNQIFAELMVKEIREHGGRVKYVLFEGEGHGWRKAETIERAIEAELAWYEESLRLALVPDLDFDERAWNWKEQLTNEPGGGKGGRLD
ncbi:hypothetical protein BS47DRAFT_1394589 [Hydnum rufescens UP504]|uniref:Peptidase S9 prolyl oligopeptidase catalytic domain-containing protein n=1 Tax=Hydnum rufescens UP504 TaxID=1448309 RepID=A0A9P6DRC5_9AGAM|nr:hypothetical protein BS47DRAFT_1394589 [Hydnum rufescens UP504]